MGALALSAVRKLVGDGTPNVSLDCHDACSTHVRKRGFQSDSDSESDSESDSLSSFSSTSSKEMQSVIYVDSRTRTAGGSDSSFEIELRESLHLDDHGV